MEHTFSNTLFSVTVDLKFPDTAELGWGLGLQKSRHWSFKRLSGPLF